MTDRPRHWLTRLLFLRLLAFIYLVAFLVVVNQWRPLLGERGILPVPLFMERVKGALGAARFFRVPTLFWFGYSDAAARVLGWAGVALSLVALSPWACWPVFLALWALYQSFVQVGQLFYGYGWETLLLETGFLAVFLCPLRPGRLLSEKDPPPLPVVWLLRWLAFRLMLGAGLIKIRGDDCWRDLTCLLTHYETQPMPNPLSWFFHHLPAVVNKAGVLFNHVVELAAPFFVLGPRRLRKAGGLLIVVFQGLLILSGNLSWLNWLTITVAVSSFSDDDLRPVFTGRTTAKVPPGEGALSRPRRIVVWILVGVVGLLSIGPAMNLLSPGQAMNASFDPLSLVNTYGAFGSVGKERYEVILEGSADGVLWKTYGCKGQPVDPSRRPPFVAPYHLRLDWQLWFAAMEDPRENTWLVHYVYKLLEGDRDALSLLGDNPFPDKPPRFVRAELYRYRFTDSLKDGWWRRERIASYLPALSRENPALLEFLRRAGWETDGRA